MVSIAILAQAAGAWQQLITTGSETGTPPESYASSGSFTLSGNWTNSFGDRWVKVEVWGGGGYGGTSTFENNLLSDGGGGGGYAMKELYVINNQIIQYGVGGDSWAKISGQSYFVYATAGQDDNANGTQEVRLGGSGTIGDVLMTGTNSIPGTAGGSGANGGGIGGNHQQLDEVTANGGGGGGGPGQNGGSPIGGVGTVRIYW